MKRCMLFLLLSLPVTIHAQNQQHETSSPVAAAPPLPLTRYQVSFATLQEGDTVNHHLGNIRLEAALDPMPVHYQLELWLDGRAVARVSNRTRLGLENLDLGRHQVFFKLFDKDGRFLALSTPITFYLHRDQLGQASQDAP